MTSPTLAPATPVIVGMSGGVDSSVAALLLKQQGADVRGVFMKNWEEDDTATHCSAEEDLRDARQVCETLGIPLQGINFAAEYWERVFEYFLDTYRAGKTPNPDILCNREIKFAAFLDYALDQGADYIATGHYARIEQCDGEFFLCRGRDSDKDQSYFLYTLGQRQLARSLFPLGDLRKPQVREIARREGLVTHGKKDSTGICFIGERDFRAFLERYLPANPGNMVTPEGDTVGRHHGLMYYTLGQRQGLGIGGLKDYPEEPWYVVGKDLDANRLIVAQGHDHPLLYSHWLEADDLHWVAGTPPSLPLVCTAKVRYRHADAACHVEAAGAGRMRVIFDTPQWAVMPGQAVVLYNGERCLGGGTIDTTQQSPQGIT